MDTDTAKIAFEEDIKHLNSYASTLEKRLRFAPRYFLATTSAVAMGATALIRFRTGPDDGGMPLLNLLPSDKYLFVSIFAVIFMYGNYTTLTYSRERKHYIKIICSINSLRSSLSDKLKLDAPYSTLWRDTKLRTWPADSVSTLTIAAIVLLTTISAVLITAIIPLSPGAIWLCAAASIISQVLIILKVSE